MGAKLRQEVAGGVFHVTSRGNNREAIYRDTIDYFEFLRAFATAVAQFGWLNLALGMRIVNGRFAQRMNRRYSRVGRLFQGPYAAEPVTRDAHFLETCRYIALNPVRAGLCARADDWPWSAHRALADLEEPASFLTVDFVRGCFGGIDEYRRFVAAGAERQRPGQDQVA